ncbi:nucleoporin Nic96 [Schizosaccharomyces japonicus yFS275]|uniref:Nuclear pore protein n=1 Tax=Schizosaccharomyces japonicus (strain yFS275 / FY16936) TaxID=402676 RepID=B6JUZ4_SCHJY|nr:nucleoporin Nic96 [Schizosaccharomyces japonicus yFS275]EEB05098.1 nucleoporin Nic96 [Schizosaccharomyces japonicus yFS275]
MTVAADPAVYSADRSLSAVAHNSKRLERELLHPILPCLQFNLGELEKRANYYLQTITPSKDGNTKAHYLLAGSGMNAEQTLKKIESINFNNGTVNYEELSVTDADVYLKYKREQNVLQSLQSIVLGTQKEFDTYISEMWKVMKSSDTPLEEQTSLKRSKVTNTLYASSARSKAFAAALLRASDERLEDPDYSVLRIFTSVAEKYGQETKFQLLVDGWKALLMLSNSGEDIGVLENAATQASKTDVSNETKTDLLNTIQHKRRIVNNSLRFLEKQFYSLVNKEVEKNSQAAAMGGVPSVRNKIRAYINLRFLRNGEWIDANLEIVNNAPVWALLFYLIRSGYLDEAVTFVNENEDAFEKFARNFPSYLKSYASSPDYILPRPIREKMHVEFNQFLRYAVNPDPYKFALYKIIGRCELSKRSLPYVCSVTEDYLWLQLKLSREFNEPTVAAHECFTLADVQKSILSFGAEYFSQKSCNPSIYFFVLLICGLFEKAIDYLYSYSPSDAAGMAIACAQHGLLRTHHDATGSASHFIKEVSPNVFSLDYPSLLTDYSYTFDKKDAKLAACYLLSICLDGKFTTVAHKRLSDLILYTRDFAGLLGDTREDGSRIPAFLETHRSLAYFDTETSFLRNITRRSAMKAEQRHQITDAILLYHLAEEYNTVVSVVNRLLGNTLSSFSQNSSFDDKPVMLAKSMLQMYASNPGVITRIDYKNRETTDLLMLSVSAFQSFSQKNYELALSSLQKLEFLPLESECDYASIKKTVQDLRFLHEAVLQNLPGLVLIAMESLKELYLKNRHSAYGRLGRESKLEVYRHQARQLIIYSSLIDYKMPSHVIESLNRLEIEMN